MFELLTAAELKFPLAVREVEASLIESSGNGNRQARPEIRFVTLDARRLAPAFRGNIPLAGAPHSPLLKLVKCAQAYCVLYIVFYSYWTSILQGAE